MPDISLNDEILEVENSRRDLGQKLRVRVTMLLLLVLSALVSQAPAQDGFPTGGQPAAQLAESRYATEVALTPGGGTRTANATNLDQSHRRENLERLLKDAAGLAVCLVAAWLLWLAVTSSRTEPQASTPHRSARVLTRGPLPAVWRAQEDERKQLSRELHDSVGQVLTAAGIELSTLRSSRLPGDQVRERLRDVSRLNAEALRLVRDLAMGLRPSLPQDIGLAAALDWQVRAFARHTGILASLDASGELGGIPEAHRICIYRCVQEGLTNCAKHSRAKSVRVIVAASFGGVKVTIEDDGIGINRRGNAASGLGILGMRERVEALRGKLVVVAGPEGGTVLSCDLPVPVEVQA